MDGCFLIHHLSKEVAVASGAIGEGGASAEPATVWYDDVIHFWEEGVSLGHDHGIQAVRARLLHALYDKLHIHWQILVNGGNSSMMFGRKQTNRLSGQKIIVSIKT